MDFAKENPFALFCNDDPRFNTHLEVYPRPNGEVYICGCGGSDYGARVCALSSRFRKFSMKRPAMKSPIRCVLVCGSRLGLCPLGAVFL